MPGRDKTGPMGTGPMTGRAEGDCAGNPVPGSENTPGGGGRGFGGGGGRRRRGRRNWFHATGLTGRQRAAVGMPAFGGGQVASAAQTETDDSPVTDKGQELGNLQQQAETLEQQMQLLRERIEQLETEEKAA